MSEEGIITYEKLYEVLRLEKYKKELQKLDLDFYPKVVRYLEEKKAILGSQESKDSVFASQSILKTRRQIENTKMILKDLYERREAKIIQIALFSSRTGEKSQETGALIDEELRFYNNLVDLCCSYKMAILDNILNGKLPSLSKMSKASEEKKEIKLNKLVKFLEPVPQFMGEDMQVYGPFESEDIANLPMKVSEILIKSNRVEEV